MAERSDQGGWTPLHLAVADGQPEVVRALVEAGADLTGRTEFNRTPLHVALQMRAGPRSAAARTGRGVDAPSAAYLGDVEQLARTWRTAPIRRPDERGGPAVLGGLRRRRGDGRTAAEPGGGPRRGGAARRGRRLTPGELVRLLIDAGADVNRRDPQTGRTPLHAAVGAGPDGDTTEIITQLLAAGADVNATTNDGASALDMARVAAARHRRSADGEAAGFDRLAEFLVAYGAHRLGPVPDRPGRPVVAGATAPCGRRLDTRFRTPVRWVDDDEASGRFPAMYPRQNVPRRRRHSTPCQA